MSKCSWANRNRFIVNPDGQVWPCCFFANIDYTQRTSKRLEEIMYHPVMWEYEKKRDQMNANNRPAHEILQDDWFNKTLPESWEEGANTHHVCTRHCKINSVQTDENSVE